MDKIAIISDIHGNIPALTAVLNDIKLKNIKKIFCLGDIVGKGPNPDIALDIIKKNCEIIVKGNWDYFLSENLSSKVSKWNFEKLGKERIEYLKTLPLFAEFYMSGKLIRIFHAAPTDLFYRVYSFSETLKKLKLFDPPNSNYQIADIVGYGDIHGAFIDHIDDKTIFNVGSVGNPLDMPLASYAVLEGTLNSNILSPLSIAIVKIPYDISKAIEDAHKEIDLPQKEKYIAELLTAKFVEKNNI